MARPKAFDPEHAVDQALEVFWSQGYEGTSTEDLVTALGINRSSLYGTFGSKHALYAQALERYGLVGGRVVREGLAGPGDVRARLRRALLRIVDDDAARGRPRGCFAANAGVERGPVDPQVRRLVRAAFAEVRDALREELVRARDAGELAPDADVEALSSALLTTLQGVRVLLKGTGDRALIVRSVDATLELI